MNTALFLVALAFGVGGSLAVTMALALWRIDRSLQEIVTHLRERK